MGWPSTRPDAVEAALSWLRQQDRSLSLDALGASLRHAGYTDLEVDEALRRRRGELELLAPGLPDLRPRAAGILTLAYVGTWGAITLALMAGTTGGYGGLSALVLGALLLPALVAGLIAVSASGRLRRGAAGATAAILTLPIVYLFVIAGICVVTTNPLR